MRNISLLLISLVVSITTYSISAKSVGENLVPQVNSSQHEDANNNNSSMTYGPSTLEIQDPCSPSPCGPNSICKIHNNLATCSCLLNFTGVPPNCGADCVKNNDCPGNTRCIRQKCQDPCPGSCGEEARCNVIDHLPMCTCPPGHTGDPFLRCAPLSPKIIESSSSSSGDNPQPMITYITHIYNTYVIRSPESTPFGGTFGESSRFFDRTPPLIID